MADDPHATAVLALLTADSLLTVYDGQVPDTHASTYVLVYMARHDVLGDDLGFPSSEAVVRFYAHSVGQNAAGARIVAGRVRAALLDKVPTVSGRVCWPIRHETSIPPTRNESTGELVMDQVDTYVLRSKAA